MNEIIRFEDRWYILATSPYGDDRTRVLKNGDTFGVFDRYGDYAPFLWLTIAFMVASSIALASLPRPAFALHR